MLYPVCSRVPLETIIFDFWRPSTSIPVDPDKAKTLGPLMTSVIAIAGSNPLDLLGAAFGGLEGWKKSNHYQ